MNLIDIISLLVKKEIDLNKFDLNLDEINYLKYLLNEQTEIFDDMQIKINLIIEDNKIDYHDIPNIVLIISDVIHVNYNKINKNINIMNIITFIMNNIIDFGFLPIPNAELTIIKKIVNTSLQLLNKNVSEKKYCLFKLFC